MSGYPLRAVIGLGNPGADHARTRHNAGFWLVDRLAERAGATFRTESRFKADVAKASVDGRDLLLVKPLTYMNLSGDAVQPLAAFYKLTAPDLMVAHDELDLPPGVVRLKRGGGHGGHNGLRSIHKPMGDAYLRLRVGIGHPGHRDRVLSYVLGRPMREEEALIMRGIEYAMSALDTLLERGWDRAAQQLHTTGADDADD